MDEQARGLTSRFGPIEVDWPRSIGYYGGISLAIALGYIEAPLGIFLAGIPLFKMLNRPQAARSLRFVAQILEGAAKPVGGDSSATIELTTQDVPKPFLPNILREARLLADQVRVRQTDKAC